MEVPSHSILVVDQQMCDVRRKKVLTNNDAIFCVHAKTHFAGHSLGGAQLLDPDLNNVVQGI